MKAPEPTPEILEKARTLVRVGFDVCFGGEVGCVSCDARVRRIALALDEAVQDERERCAGLALNPYGDEVAAMGPDEPFAVGKKIAAAIREV